MEAGVPSLLRPLESFPICALLSVALSRLSAGIPSCWAFVIQRLVSCPEDGIVQLFCPSWFLYLFPSSNLFPAPDGINVVFAAEHSTATSSQHLVQP